MEFELKTYKDFKIKYYLKENKLFFVYTTTSINSKNWLTIEQTLKKYNLNHYRLSNNLAIRTIEVSAYRNYKHFIHSLTMFISSKSKTPLKLKNLISLEKVLTMLSVKLNNKIYTISQLKNLISLDHNFNILQLFQFFIVYLIFIYKITQKNLEIM